MQYVTLNTFQGLTAEERDRFIQTAIADLIERVRVLWVANAHAVDVIQARNDVKALQVKITSAKGRVNDAQREQNLQRVTGANRALLVLERKYLSDSHTKGSDAVLADAKTLAVDVNNLLQTVQQVTRTLATIYDSFGSNREIIAASNEGRMYLRSLEEIKNRVMQTQWRIEDVIEQGLAISDMVVLLKTVRKDIAPEQKRIQEYVKRVQVLTRRFDVKRSTIQKAHTFLQWTPRIERRLGNRYRELAARLEEVILMGTKPFPDPITETVLGLRASNLAVDTKVMLCGILHDNVLALSKGLPPVCDTVMDAQHNDERGIDAQVDDVYEFVLEALDRSNRTDVAPDKLKELKLALLGVKPGVKNAYRAKLQAWISTNLGGQA